MTQGLQAHAELGADQPQKVDAILVGAGFGGMYMAQRLRGMGLSFAGIEAGGDVGGVWYWNRYPGARCDVFSIDYSYSFSDEIQQEWSWSEEYSAQPEILAYANFVADKLDLRKHFHFNTRVISATFDDARSLWIVKTNQGQIFEANYCIMATGPLSIPKDIDIEGWQDFDGELYRAPKWPHQKVDFKGKRVGVIGTGSSGIQIVPIVAEEAAELFVFQRTPSFTFPMRNKPLTPEYTRQIKQRYGSLRASARNTFTGGVRPLSTRPVFSIPSDEREELLEDAWQRGGRVLMGMFSDVLTDPDANAVVADFVREKIGQVVHDPATAEALKPRGYPIFSRRPCLDTDYYETYNRQNVHLIDCLKDPIEGITPQGVKTASGEIELDVLVLATGYDGLTGAMLAMEVTGREGRLLSDKWQDGARSYLGLAMAGFPNLFMICGANSPSALANIVILNEENGDWVGNCIEFMHANGLSQVEATLEAEDKWVDTVATLAEKSLIPKANTWYVGSNISGKPRVFPIYTGGLNKYREICADIAANGYTGFIMR